MVLVGLQAGSIQGRFSPQWKSLKFVYFRIESTWINHQFLSHHYHHARFLSKLAVPSPRWPRSPQCGGCLPPFPGLGENHAAPEASFKIQLNWQYANRCNAVVHRFKDEIRLLCSLNMSRVFQDFSFVGHKIKPLEAPLQNAGSLNPSRSTAASLSNGIKGRCNCRCCRLLTTWHLSFPAPTESR